MSDWITKRISKSVAAFSMLLGKRHRLWKRSTRKPSRQSGQSLILIAVAFMGVVAFLGFAIDTGILYLNRIWLGQAVDSAALAAGFELPDIQGACSRAVEYLASNGYVANTDFHFTITFPEETNGPGGTIDALVLDSLTDSLNTPADCSSITTSSDHASSHYHVQIAGELTLPVVFMRVLGFDTIDVGIPATAKRTAVFDVALVVDESLSMQYDTCEIYPICADPPVYPCYPGPGQYACENRYDCDSDDDYYFEEYFDTYADIAAMDAGPWDLNTTDAVELDSNDFVHVFLGPAPGNIPGNIDVTLDTASYGYIHGEKDFLSLYFKILNDSGWEGLEDNELIRIFWQSSTSPTWKNIFSVRGIDIDSSEWTQFALVLNLEKMYDADFKVRFELDSGVNTNGEGLFIDDVELRECTQKGELAQQYVWNNTKMDCTNVVDSNCTAADQVPGVSHESWGPPLTLLMEQPMTDVIRGSLAFVDMIDQRFDDSGLPQRQDRIALITYSSTAGIVIPLADTDTFNSYDPVRNALWNMTGKASTNIGGGMRIGLAELASNGRSYSTHFIILLTDGVFTAYDRPDGSVPGCPQTSRDPDCYEDEGDLQIGRTCGGNFACPGCYHIVRAMITKARNNNVTIFTIGLGTDVKTKTWNEDYIAGDPALPRTAESLLKEIADDTTGQYFFAPDTSKLQEIFEWIAEAIFVRLTL